MPPPLHPRWHERCESTGIMLDRNQTVASVVLDHSECAEVFQRHRIDYCCHGDTSIEASARTRGLDVETLVDELSRAIAERRGDRRDDPRTLSTARLVAHIVSKHHEYLRKVLPFLDALAQKVGRVHGEHDPLLRDLASAVNELGSALLLHLDEEELKLFPALVAAERSSDVLRASFASMVDDHLAVASLLTRIRVASRDFTLPDWACNSYRTLFAELAQLEADIFTHVHLENHVLMPRFQTDGAARAEASTAGS